MLQEKNAHPGIRKVSVLFLVFVILLTYMPQGAVEAFAATKASVSDGRTLEGSDGKSYYPNQKGGGYYWAKFSNKEGTGFVYRLARATSAKKTIVVKTGGSTYPGYCLEHGAWMNAGNTGYSADEQADLMKLKWFKPYSDSAKEGMRLAMLFGRQPGMSQKDVPVAGCNLDDWYWATQNIIWEFQQGLRKSVDSGLSSRTGNHSMDANWFRDTVKGRPAEKMYNWMLKEMKLYKKIPSFTASTEKKIKAKQTIKLEDQGNGTWSATVTDANGIKQDIKSLNKHVKITRNGSDYTITCDVNPETVTDAIKAVKKTEASTPKEGPARLDNKPKSPIADSNHLQTVATGGDDPVQMFFKINTTPPEPTPEEPPIPEVPSFTFDVEKMDKNPGFDQGSGWSHTGMGDAPLDSEITLYVGGEVFDVKELDVNGYSDSPFEFMPWDDISELDMEKNEVKDPETGKLLYTEYIYTGEKDVYTEETKVPQGRFDESTSGTGSGKRDHGTIRYWARCTDEPAGPEYNITYIGPDGTEVALTDPEQVSPDNPQPMQDDMGDRAYVNDNYRGRLQIIKTKSDQDPFTDNGGGVTGGEGSSSNTGGGSDNVSEGKYSTKSEWTIRLKSGGYEDHAYIRVVPMQKGEADYDAYANNYRVVRDNSGVSVKDKHLRTSKFGQINVVDLPYGLYVVEEVSADANGYVLESFEVQVTEDGQLISVDNNNIPKKNKVQIIKVNSETGKPVRLNENAAFRIKYLGCQDHDDPTQDKNYGRYLPNGSSYNDGDESGKNNYIFKCNENGQIVLPYKLEYGIYQIEEVVVPEGYYVGEYDEKGNGSSTDMPKDFEDTVVIYDEQGNRVMDFTNNDKIIFNKYKFTVDEQTPHQDGKDYVTYYLTIKMKNNPVKGKIQITKNGESLAGWLSGKFGSYDGYNAVWDKTRLKNAKFNVYAAEDVRQVDNVQQVKAFDSDNDEEIALEEVTRDHSKIDGAKSFWNKILETGQKILRWIGLDVGPANECRTEYEAKQEKGAEYVTDYYFSENGLTTKYSIEYGLNYTKGGMNYTRIHVKKDIVADDYVASIDAPKPVLKTGDQEVDIMDLILENKNMIDLNKDTIDEYGKDDIHAKILQPQAIVNPFDLDVDPQADEGWNFAKLAGKYMESKEVEELDEAGNPVLGEDGQPVTKTIYKIYVDDNGEMKWVDCDKDGNFEDTNVPKDLPEGFTRIEKAGMFQVSATVENETVYKVWAVENGSGRWVNCDADGNFYKSYHQEYDFTVAQHFDVEDGFVFTFDGWTVDAKADNEAQKAVTIVTNPWNTAPQIKISSAYTYETVDNITTFTAEPKDKAPVYFKNNDGIETSMLYLGGQTITTVMVKQSQLYMFGEDSKPGDTFSVEKTYPFITYDGEKIDWLSDLRPDNEKFEQVFDANNFIKVKRHEVSPDNKDEVCYEITMVSNSKDENKGFLVTYPDTTTMTSIVGSDEGEDAGIMIFKSIEGTMMYPLGSPVATIETDENGIATTPNLPLGKYYIQEVSTAAGHVNNGQWRKFNLEYKDQYTPLIWDEAELDNDAVSVKIDLTKVLETAYKSKKYQPGGGAVFGVFTGETITAKTKTDKDVTAKSIDADTLVGTITIMPDGTGTTVAKLPQGKYYVKELSAPSGYKLNGTKYYFDAVDQLTADQIDFAYRDIGVSGKIVQDGNDNTVISIESLYSKPMNKMTIDGKEYDLLTDVAEENITHKVLDGRTKSTVVVPHGKSSTITFANGSVLTITADKNTYTAVFDGAKSPKLDLGNETTLTKTVEGSKTTVAYKQKVNQTIFLGEVTMEYVAPVGDKPATENGWVTIQPANNVLELTSPEGTSAVKASVDYEYGTAELTFPVGTVSSITVDGEAVEHADTVTLKRIVRTPADEEAGTPATEVNKTTNAVINFADGVSFTVELDEAGNFYMSDSGQVTKDLETESTLTVDGKAMNDETGYADTIRFKNTTAKAYARNNSDANVLNIVIKSIKNDKLPTDVPEIPDIPDIPGPTPDRPSIRTTAIDSETRDHIANADGKATIVDTVKYWNLTPGKEYLMKGTLMDKATGKPVLVDGKEVTAEKKFTPEKANGSVDIEFTFDASKLDGKTTVVFEEIYQMKDTDKDGKPDTPEEKPVADHKDILDEGQTIYFPEIKTTATDSETNDHIANADGKVTIIDVVAYENLIPGKEYTMSGVLMNKATGKPILVKGKKVTAEKTFTPATADGSVSLEFKLNASELAGTTTVVFEHCSMNGKEVASHKDLKDKYQTVHFPELRTSASHTATGVITDIVTYKNLIPGKEYTVSGVLMDKETGNPVLCDGKKVTAETTFTPTKPDGKVSLNFYFREADLYGKTTVVFEKMKVNGVLIGSHEDLNDKAQTVTFDTPDEPKTPTNTDIPKTGDTNNIIPYLAALLGGILGITLYVARRKKDDEDK